jgi:pimeloyl-ACP methyl ester carboxylesterase
MKLVLLPGMDGTGELFSPFLASLSRSHDPIVVNYPENHPLSYERLEEIARTFLPAHDPYVLLAESFSGPIAISIAASAPRGLVGLVLCCAFARTPQPRLSAMESIIRIVPAFRAPAFVAEYLLLGSNSDRSIQAQLNSVLEKVSPNVLKFRLLAVLKVDVTSKLPKLTVPVLYLRATRDKIVPKSAGLEILENIPAAQVVEVDAPHFLLQSSPSHAAEIVEEFVKECASAL